MFRNLRNVGTNFGGWYVYLDFHDVIFLQNVPTSSKRKFLYNTPVTPLHQLHHISRQSDFGLLKPAYCNFELAAEEKENCIQGRSAFLFSHSQVSKESLRWIGS